MFSFIGQVFNLFIGRPIFNLLVLILAFLPGHNLGVTIIIFTIIVRFAMYPLLKKQLHHAMAMRKLQPEMRRIKKEAAGDKQKESQMTMALYKEKEVNPFSSIGIILVQLPILIALYQAVDKIVKNPESIVTNAYYWVQNIPFVKELSVDITKFDETLLGFVDLTKPALSSGQIYWPAMILVIGSVAVQYFQSKQLMMTDKSARSLRKILKDSAAGKQVDSMEMQAATSRFTLYIIPFFIFVVTVNLASALALYWLVGGLVALAQQTYILRKDVEELEATVDNEPVEAEIIVNKTPKPKTKSKKKSGSKKGSKSKKRR